jgi:hypothetical protein
MEGEREEGGKRSREGGRNEEKEGGREEGREGGREEKGGWRGRGRKEGKEAGREGGRKRRREGGRKEGREEVKEGGMEGGNAEINTLTNCTANQSSTCIDITFVDNSQFPPYPVLVAYTFGECIKLQLSVALSHET